MASTEEKVFEINVPDEKLARLCAKLDLVELPDELEDAGWNYGAPLSDIKRLVERWKDGFTWREQEGALNYDLPQFTRNVEIEGHGVLNMHQPSKNETAIPLLFVHGWSGSFVEVRKILPMLTTSPPDHPSFHVVALSLPGYGFSEAPSKRGRSIAQYAETGNKLMLSLGYEQYVTPGGDWGSRITRKMATLYGGHNVPGTQTILCMHSPHSLFPLLHSRLLQLRPSVAPPQPPCLSLEPSDAIHGHRESRCGAHSAQHGDTRGYSAQQSTQPQTLGYSLAGTPIGLLAWIYEKLVAWTDEYKWDDDEVLMWASIYWFSWAGPAATLRIYCEVAQSREREKTLAAPPPSMGASYFPKELVSYPRRIAGNFNCSRRSVRGVAILRRTRCRNCWQAI